MEVNCLNQKPCIPSWPGVFQFDILFSVVLSKLICISVLGPSSSPFSSLVILFIHSAFSLCFLVAIFSSKIVRFLLHLVVGMFSCHSLPIVDRIVFRCFGKSCFVCIVLPFVYIPLIFLLSPALPGLFSQVVQLFFSCVACSFFPRLFQRLSFFIILACFRSFFICVSSRIFHPSFDCFFELFEAITIFSQTNFAPAQISSFNSVILFVGM